MFYILYGPDTYRSRKKLNEIIDEYRTKAGVDAEVHTIDCEESSIDRVTSILEAGSLFAKKRMCVILYPFSSKQDLSSLESVLRQVKDSKETFCVLFDGDIKKEKTALTKIFPIADKVQEFLPLQAAQLEKWIIEEARTRGVSLGREEKEWFFSMGADLWRISNELDKMALGVHEKKDERRAVIPTTIFSLGDSFFSLPSHREVTNGGPGNNGGVTSKINSSDKGEARWAGSRGRALFHLLTLMKKGEDEMMLFSYLSNHLRTLFTIKAFSDRREPVGQKFKIHPFVQKKAASIVRDISLSRFSSSLKRFWDEDRKIKVGETKPLDSLIRILFQQK